MALFQLWCTKFQSSDYKDPFRRRLQVKTLEYYHMNACFKSSGQVPFRGDFVKSPWSPFQGESAQAYYSTFNVNTICEKTVLIIPVI